MPSSLVAPLVVLFVIRFVVVKVLFDWYDRRADPWRHMLRRLVVAVSFGGGGGGACIFSSSSRCVCSFFCSALQRSSFSFSLLYCSCLSASDSMVSFPFTLVIICGREGPACSSYCLVLRTSSRRASILLIAAMSRRKCRGPVGRPRVVLRRWCQRRCRCCWLWRLVLQQLRLAEVSSLL